MLKIERINCFGFKALKLENELASLITIPDLGGKIISLVNKKSGFEFIFNNNYSGLIKSSYGDDFSKARSFGVDECFPSIGPSKYTEFPWKGIEIPDHGEIWPLLFESEINNDIITQSVHGIRFPYLFQRNIDLNGNKFTLSYEVKNLSSMDFKYLYSFHPQFRLLDEVEVLVRNKAKFLVYLLYYDKSNKLIFKKSKYTWPNAKTMDGEIVNFSRVSEMVDGSLLKLYLYELLNKEVTINFKKQKAKIIIGFNNIETKYCGIMINKGGWPFAGRPFYTFAIEPCNCVTDNFEDSYKRGIYSTIKGKSEVRWEISFKIGD